MENEANALADKIKSQNGENFEKINAETETLVDVRIKKVYSKLSSEEFHFRDFLASKWPF